MLLAMAEARRAMASIVSDSLLFVSTGVLVDGTVVPVDVGCVSCQA